MPNEYTFRYGVRNWPDYNRALIDRGTLTFWSDENAVAAWRNADPNKGPGAPKVYSDTAIQCALVLKSVFNLSLRSTQGFVSSLLGFMTAVCYRDCSPRFLVGSVKSPATGETGKDPVADLSMSHRTRDPNSAVWYTAAS